MPIKKNFFAASLWKDVKKDFSAVAFLDSAQCLVVIFSVFTKRAKNLKMPVQDLRKPQEGEVKP